MKQVGEKFDTICENCSFHFYDVESAVKLAHKALDAAASAREALGENALDLRAAIGRAVLRTAQGGGGLAEGAMEKAFTRANAPTLDMARHEVEKKIDEWKTREQKPVRSGRSGPNSANHRRRRWCPLSVSPAGGLHLPFRRARLLAGQNR